MLTINNSQNSNLKAKEELELILASKLFENSIQSCEDILNDISKLKHSIRYNNTQLNNLLNDYFSQFTEVLQKCVDKYYFNYYEVQNYVTFTGEKGNFNYALEVNKRSLCSIKKLINFIQ